MPVDVYLFREAEYFGTILRGSVTRQLLISSGLYYLSDSVDWQLFIKKYDRYLSIFVLVPTQEYCMKILPYPCYTLGFLLQDFKSFTNDSTEILKKSAADDRQICKTRATVGGSHKENAFCMFKDKLSMSVGTTPRL